MQPGTRLGPYEVLAIIGSGGMAEIYRARDVRLGREVAIKILPEALSADPEALARFEYEARSASALNHPHLVTIHDIGEATVDDHPVRYMAMELVRGSTLRNHMRSDERGVLLRHLANVADGLACAHDHGIIHRDLKPDNVMVSDDGFAKVVDFGLAKQVPIVMGDATAPLDVGAPLTSKGMIVGTVGYMAPEQVSGNAHVDQRADVFAFGCILYEAVAKRKAFEGETGVDVLHNILRQEPEPLPDASLDHIVRRCLAKNPAQRYSSMHELAEDIRDAIEKTEVRRAVPSRVPRAWWWGIAAAVMVIAVVALIVVLRVRHPAIESIAVLPFTGAVPEMEFLGEGMANDIVRDLSRISDLRVIANSSTARYRGAKDPRAAARELNVDAVLTANMTANAGILSLDAQLVRTADGARLWGRKYTRSIGEAASLERELVGDLTARTGLKLAPQRSQTRNPEAYAEYQRWRRRSRRHHR